MAVTARISNEFLCSVSEAPTGLTGTIRVRIVDSEGTTVTAPSAAAIIEVLTGVYRAKRTAPADAGTYLLIWDQGDDTELSEPEELYVSGSLFPDPPEGLTPDKAEVGAVIRARTLAGDDDPDHPGVEQGTFTAYTRPDGSEADTLIDQAAMEMMLRLPATPTDAVMAYARRLIAIRAAMLIELSYFPEATNADGSTYESLKTLFDEGMVILNDALGDAGQGPDLRIGSIPVTSSTVSAYQDVFGVDLNADLPLS